jgi:hypothetical protein
MKASLLKGSLGLLLFAGALFAAASAQAVEGILPVCNTNRCFNKCDNDCRVGSQDMTCLEWYNRFSNDGDADGVPYPGDNCPCGANANQANCDGDAMGDSCDPVNENWVLVADLGRCDWDPDTHLWYYTIEQYGARRYRNTCNNAFCSDRYLISDADCTFSASGCGSSSGACCDCHYEFFWCTGPDQCGGPACPF